MKKLTTRQIALNGVVAGLYAAITILTASFAYGNIQFRIADSLCVLVVLEPSLTVGLTLGCLISNIFSTVSALDIVIGTAGTLLGCLLAARVKRDWLVPVPVILANAVLVGAMLAYVLTPDALAFPSGHTAASFAAVFALWASGSPLWKPAAVLASVIAFSRLYLYVHWPTDVLGGILVGAAAGWAGARLADALRRRRERLGRRA